MPDLEYKITTTADGTGAKQTAQDIDEINRAARGATPAAADLGKEFDKTGEHMTQFGSKGREIYILFAELNRLIPGLGDSLRSLNAVGLNPVIATLSLVALAFYESKKAITDWNKSLDDSAAAAADPTFLDGINARITVLAQAKTAAEEYAQKEAAVAVGEQTIATALQNQLQYMAAIEQARGQQTQAQKALALAKIGQAETEGNLTPSQAIEQRAGVEKEFAAREFTEKQQAATDKFQTGQLNLFVAKQVQPLLDSVKTAADSRATQAEAKFRQAQEDAKKFEKPEDVKAAMKPLEDAVATAQQRVHEEQINVSRSGLMPEQNARDKAALASAQQQLGNAQKAAEGMQDHIRQLQRESGESAKENLGRLKGTADLADKKAQEGLDAIAKLQSEVEQQGKIISGTGPLSASTQNAQQQTISTTETTGLEKQAREDVEKYHRDIASGNFKDALAVLQDLNNALAGHAEVLQYVQGLGVNVSQLHAAISELKTEMHQTASRGNSYLLQ